MLVKGATGCRGVTDDTSDVELIKITSYITLMAIYGALICIVSILQRIHRGITITHTSTQQCEIILRQSILNNAMEKLTTTDTKMLLSFNINSNDTIWKWLNTFEDSIPQKYIFQRVPLYSIWLYKAHPINAHKFFVVPSFVTVISYISLQQI